MIAHRAARLLLLLGFAAGCSRGSTAPPAISIGGGKADSPFALSLELVAGQRGAKGSADGVADDARFSVPNGMAMLGDALYVVDLESRLLRRVDALTGAVTTATNGAAGAAQLVRPTEIAGDGDNLVYVVDELTSIRRYDTTTRVLDTVTTFPAVPTCADRDALFLAATTAKIYVSDRCAGVVRAFDLATQAWSVVAGDFTRLQSIALDPYGTLHVVDGARLRRIDASGAVTTLGDATLVDNGAPLHLAFADGQTAILSDGNANTLISVDLSTGARTPLSGVTNQSGNADGTASVARYSRPAGVASDGLGRIFVADSLNNTIRSVELFTGTAATLAGRGQQSGATDGASLQARFQAPEAITTDRAGNLYVADSANHVVRRIDGSTGAVTTFVGTLGTSGAVDGVGTAASFNHPAGLAADAERLYIADTNNHTIRVALLRDGTVSTLAGQPGVAGALDALGVAASFRRPQGLAVEGGRLYVADTENSAIRQVELGSGRVTTLAGRAGFGGSQDGSGADARFAWPTGLHGDGHGTLYVADTNNRLVRQIEVGSGRVTTIAGSPVAKAPWSVDGVGDAARFHFPSDVLPDTLGHVFVADAGNNSVRMITLATGRVTTIVGASGQAGVRLGLGTGGLNWPVALTAGPDGSLIIVDRRESAILRLH